MTIHTNHPLPIETFAASEVAEVALNVFLRLTREWCLDQGQALILLGSPDSQTFRGWRDGTISTLPKEALERISLSLGIYKATHNLLPVTDHANAWLTRSNTEFGGDSALDVMLKGGLEDLYRVRRYLDAMLG